MSVQVKPMTSEDRDINGHRCRSCGAEATTLMTVSDPRSRPNYITTVTLCGKCREEARKGFEKKGSAE